MSADMPDDSPGFDLPPGRPGGRSALSRAGAQIPSSTFDDLIGQEPMVRTLSNAFASGRIAQAYILTGVRGVGKTTTARILARALNYEPMAGAAVPRSICR